MQCLCLLGLRFKGLLFAAVKLHQESNSHVFFPINYAMIPLMVQ